MTEVALPPLPLPPSIFLQISRLFTFRITRSWQRLLSPLSPSHRPFSYRYRDYLFLESRDHDRVPPPPARPSLAKTLHHRWLCNNRFLPSYVSTALIVLAKAIPIHFFKIVFTSFLWPISSSFPLRPLRYMLSVKPEDYDEMWRVHLSIIFLTMVRSLFSPIATWIFLQISLIVTGSFMSHWVAFYGNSF